MRLLFLIAILPAFLFAQDARQIIVHAIEMDRKDTESSHNYSYLQREVETDLDGSGKPKSKIIRTWDVTMQEGSPYRRLVARNDQPLSLDEQKQEEEKMKWSVEQRHKETPEQRNLRIETWRRREVRRREPLRELPDAFDFRLIREEAVNGGATYVIEATPKPGYKPKSTATSFFPKVKLQLWIDKREFQCVRAEMESQGTITLGGFLVRVAKGGRLLLEQTRVNDEVWLPKRFSMEASARLMLVKGYHKSLDMTFSDYKKAPADTRILAMEPAAR